MRFERNRQKEGRGMLCGIKGTDRRREAVCYVV